MDNQTSVVRLNTLLRLHILPMMPPLLVGFRHGKTVVICGQKIGSGFRGAKHRFQNQAVVDALPVWREPYRELADQFLIGFMEIKLDCLSV